MDSAGDSQPASLYDAIRNAEHDPKTLEHLYQTARQTQTEAQFTTDMLACHEAMPENMLYAAWYHRLQWVERAAPPPAQAALNINWSWAIPLSLACGLAFWYLTDARAAVPADFGPPDVFIFWSPVVALTVLGYNALTRKTPALRTGVLAAIVVAVTAYALAFTRSAAFQAWRAYFDVALAHLPVLGWAAVALSILGFRSTPGQRFVAIAKTIEVVGTGAIYGAGIAIFGAITQGMFSALSVNIPEPILRLIFGGGAGAVPLLAYVTTYDPELPPESQDLRRGLGKIIALMMRLLLPLALIVLLIYLFIIPGNFMQPFNNREVLIVYNLMLFAVVVLLIGAIPLTPDDLSLRWQRWLRGLMVAVTALTTLVSLYALAAILYRTMEDSLTMNRLAVIGWNSLNIAILAAILVTQFIHWRGNWSEVFRTVIGHAIVGYVLWAMGLLLAIPLFF